MSETHYTKLLNSKNKARDVCLICAHFLFERLDKSGVDAESNKNSSVIIQLMFEERRVVQ